MVTQFFASIVFPIRWVMDARVSPLRHLPDGQRYQIMCLLGTLWTFIFCLSFGAWAFYGLLLAAHALVALGALITGLTFYFASFGEGADSSSRIEGSSAPLRVRNKE